MMHVSAAVRLIPTPPALVDKRNTKLCGSRLNLYKIHIYHYNNHVIIIVVVVVAFVVAGEKGKKGYSNALSTAREDIEAAYTTARLRGG